jgi:hypothetical protein
VSEFIVLETQETTVVGTAHMYIPRVEMDNGYSVLHDVSWLYEYLPDLARGRTSGTVIHTGELPGRAVASPSGAVDDREIMILKSAK